MRAIATACGTGPSPLSDQHRQRKDIATHHRAQARDAQPLGTREALAGFRLDITPGGTRARVEQHADDGEVDLRPRALGRRAAGQRAPELAAAIDAARFEMAPAAVVRNDKI